VTVAVTVEQTLTATATTAIICRGAASRGSATTIAGASAAMATMTGQSRVVLTAHEGDADHREKDRDAKNQCTIHPIFLQQNRYRTVRRTHKLHCRLPGHAHQCDGATEGNKKPNAVCRPASIVRVALLQNSSDYRVKHSYTG
jgi:hypothetical protein